MEFKVEFIIFPLPSTGTKLGIVVFKINFCKGTALKIGKEQLNGDSGVDLRENE